MCVVTFNLLISMYVVARKVAQFSFHHVMSPSGAQFAKCILIKDASFYFTF